MLLHRDGVIRAALDGAVIRDNDARNALDNAYAGNDAPRRHVCFGVELVSGQRRQLQERRSGVYECRDPVAREHLFPGDVLVPGLGGAALLRPSRQLLQPRHGFPHESFILLELVRARVDAALYDGYGIGLVRSCVGRDCSGREAVVVWWRTAGLS